MATDTPAPMAPDINAAARAERDKALAALDAAITAINTQWSGMTPAQKQDALKHIGHIGQQKDAISAAFVDTIFGSQAHRNVISQIADATTAMNAAVKDIKDTTTALNNAAKILGYAGQIAGLFASLAG